MRNSMFILANLFFLNLCMRNGRFQNVTKRGTDLK
jgi:hypothetical protein